jgi:hypothetical protein
MGFSTVFWDEVGAEVGAFDAENRLVFAPGPLTGTLAPGSGRMELVSKSPRSYPRETVTRSGMGGFWGSELKYAGYDALIVQGKSESGNCMRDDRVEFGRRGSMWVRTRTDADEFEELGPNTRIVCIVRRRAQSLGWILSETSFCLRAVGVWGGDGVEEGEGGCGPERNRLNYDPKRLIEVSQSQAAVREPMGVDLPRPDSADQDSFLNKYRKTWATSAAPCNVLPI